MALKPTIPVDGNYGFLKIYMHGPTKKITEVHWYQAQNALVQMMKDANPLAKARNKLLGSDATLDIMVGSLENVDGDSQVDPTVFNLPIMKANGPADPGDTDLLIRMSGTEIYRRSLHLGLIPDNAIVAGKWAPAAVGTLATDLDAYLSLLVPTPGTPAGPWGFLVRDKNPARAPFIPILSVTVDPAGTTMTITTPAVVAISPGDVVQVSNFSDINGRNPLINGEFIVAATTGIEVTVQGSFPVGYTALAIAGTVHKLIHTFQAYSNTALRGISELKRGARALVPLGRKRNPRPKG